MRKQFAWASATWRCADMRFSFALLSIDSLDEARRTRINAIPTRLTLDAGDVDATIEGAREGAMRLPQLQEYLKDRAHP